MTPGRRDTTNRTSGTTPRKIGTPDRPAVTTARKLETADDEIRANQSCGNAADGSTLMEGMLLVFAGTPRAAYATDEH